MSYFNRLNSFLFNSVQLNPVFSACQSAFNADGNANDFFNYANGTLVNGASASGAPKVGTNSFSLDGVNDYVNCGLNKWNVSTKLSVAFWVNLQDTWSQRIIIGNFNLAASYSGWQIFTYANALYYQYGTAPAQLTKAFNFTNVWKHVVLTQDIDAAEVKLYIDGVLSQTWSTSYPHSNTLNNFSVLGCQRQDSGTYYFLYGLLDAVQISTTHIWSLSEVQQIYNSGNGLQP